MRIMIDTNVIISSVLFPKGRAAEALKKALTYPYEPILCDYVINEVHRKILEKWPESHDELEEFLSKLLKTIDVVPTPGEDLASIAIAYGISPSALMDVNDLKPTDEVKPGQILKLPANAKPNASNGQ